MKLSILSNLFIRFPIEKAFEMVSAIGYDGLEVCGVRPHCYAYDMDEARCAEIRRLKEKHGLEIPMYSPELLMYPYNLSSPYKKEREDTIAYVKRSIEAAAGMGTTRMQLTCGHAGYFTDKAESLVNVTESLKQVAAHAEKYNIDLILEALTIMESNTVVMLDTVVDLFEKVGSPRLKGMIDSAMVMTNWEPLDDYFGKLGDKMAYLHWGDNKGTSERHFPIGDGLIDPVAFFDIVHRHGYDGWVSVELFGEYVREPELHAGREYHKLREVLAKYN